MRRSTRGGVFGGNAGLWLFQKKFRAIDHESNQPPQQRGLTITTRHDTLYDTSGSNFSITNDKASCPESSSPHSTQLSTTSCASSSCSSQQTNDELSTTILTDSSSDVHQAVTTDLMKSRRRGVFGVRKRHFENYCTGDTTATEPSAMSFLDIKKHRSVQTLQSQRVIDSPAISQSHPSIPIENDSDSLEDIGRKEVTHRQKLRTNKIVDVSITQESESNSVFDFEKDSMKHKNISCKSDVIMARQFFAQLDADETLLNLEDVREGSEPPSTRKKSRVVRTSRGKLPPDVIRNEYRKYCQTCHLSKVKPLSMEHFLHQRSEYFRVGDIFDGMFDE